MSQCLSTSNIPFSYECYSLAEKNEMMNVEMCGNELVHKSLKLIHWSGEQMSGSDGSSCTNMERTQIERYHTTTKLFLIFYLLRYAQYISIKYAFSSCNLCGTDKNEE